ncbi:MAG: hypothetical protein M3Q59_02120 [Actinomycetota bacterium]|nr:hypothetical protein [Actinomycetota bacterium]
MKRAEVAHDRGARALRVRGGVEDSRALSIEVVPGAEPVELQLEPA